MLLLVALIDFTQNTHTHVRQTLFSSIPYIWNILTSTKNGEKKICGIHNRYFSAFFLDDDNKKIVEMKWIKRLFFSSPKRKETKTIDTFIVIIRNDDDDDDGHVYKYLMKFFFLVFFLSFFPNWQYWQFRCCLADCSVYPVFVCVCAVRCVLLFEWRIYQEWKIWQIKPSEETKNFFFSSVGYCQFSFFFLVWNAIVCVRKEKKEISIFFIHSFISIMMMTDSRIIIVVRIEEKKVFPIFQIWETNIE